MKVKEVLDCADMQEFITWYAKEKLKKLQRGSVKGFIADNKAIKSLNVFDATRIDEIEKILQIRHLYTHQNGIVDDKFRQYFPATKVNDEYRMTLDEFPDTLRLPCTSHRSRRRGSAQGLQTRSLLMRFDLVFVGLTESRMAHLGCAATDDRPAYRAPYERSKTTLCGVSAIGSS